MASINKSIWVDGDADLVKAYKFSSMFATHLMYLFVLISTYSSLISDTLYGNAVKQLVDFVCAKIPVAITLKEASLELPFMSQLGSPHACTLCTPSASPSPQGVGCKRLYVLLCKREGRIVLYTGTYSAYGFTKTAECSTVRRRLIVVVKRL